MAKTKGRWKVIKGTKDTRGEWFVTIPGMGGDRGFSTLRPEPARWLADLFNQLEAQNVMVADIGPACIRCKTTGGHKRECANGHAFRMVKFQSGCGDCGQPIGDHAAEVK